MLNHIINMNKISELFTYNSKSKYNFKRKKTKLY